MQPWCLRPAASSRFFKHRRGGDNAKARSTTVSYYRRRQHENSRYESILIQFVSHSSKREIVLAGLFFSSRVNSLFKLLFFNRIGIPGCDSATN